MEARGGVPPRVIHSLGGRDFSWRAWRPRSIALGVLTDISPRAPSKPQLSPANACPSRKPRSRPDLRSAARPPLPFVPMVCISPAVHQSPEPAVSRNTDVSNAGSLLHLFRHRTQSPFAPIVSITIRRMASRGQIRHMSQTFVRVFEHVAQIDRLLGMPAHRQWWTVQTPRVLHPIWQQQQI